MKQRFSTLQTKIRRRINNVGDFRAHVVGTGILKEDDETLMKRADNIDDIFTTVLTKYWSFLDYENFESIVVNMCGDDSDQEWKQYKDEVQKFCERRVSELPNGSLEDSSTRYEGMEKLVVKLNLDDPVLSRIKYLKEVIANILGVRASRIILQDIKAGSIVVTFLIAATLGKELFERTKLTKQQKLALSEAGVITMEFKSTVIMDVVSEEKCKT